MPTPPKGPRLGGSPAHERLILANLARSLFEHGKITTTETKAKRLRPVAEKLITAAKRGSLHSRREVLKTIRDKDVLHKLFAEIGPSFATRDGGYTRITKTLPRKGDNAPMAVIELIGEETVSSAASRVARTAASRRAGRKAEAAAPAAAEPAVPQSGAAAAADADGADGADGAAEAAQDAVPQSGAAAEPQSGAAETSQDAVPQSGAADAEPEAEPEVEESASTPDAPYGAGSHAPLADGTQPDGFPVKGNADSMLYHVPGSSHYEQTIAEVWFATPDAAEAAGFSLPASQRPAADSDEAADPAGPGTPEEPAES